MRHQPDDNDRLIQVFLGKDGLYEVFQHLYSLKIWCTCPGGQVKNHQCKHLHYIHDHIERNNGMYRAPLTKDCEVTEDEFNAATKDAAVWARVIRRYIVPQVV